MLLQGLPYRHAARRIDHGDEAGRSTFYAPIRSGAASDDQGVRATQIKPAVSSGSVPKAGPQLCLPLLALGVLGCGSAGRRLDAAASAAGGSPVGALDGGGSVPHDALNLPDLSSSAPNAGGLGGATGGIWAGGALAGDGGTAGAGGAGPADHVDGGGQAGTRANGSFGGDGGGGGEGVGGAGPAAGASGAANGAGLESQCNLKAAPSCFEPCGGDLSGNWVLEDACFGPAATHKGVCDTFISGTSTKSNLLLTSSGRGELTAFGTESWSISATMSLGCRGLASADLCASASLLSDALLFSYTQPMSCSQNACGACDCQARDVNGAIAFPLTLPVDPLQVNFLRSGPFTFPYCVMGDVLWIGGSAQDGTPKVSYKLRKHSCQGTTTPCAQRALDQCELGQGCNLGSCTNAVPDPPVGCEDATTSNECLARQGCVWNPNVCVGTPDVSCDPTVCGTRPGCTWGDPMQRCTGQSDCAYRSPDQCVGSGLAGGCSLRPCEAPSGATSDKADCRLILNAADCANAPGCIAHPRSAATPCTGVTSCASQTDLAICSTLSCYAQVCSGTSTPCSQIPVANCSSVPGCQISW